MTAGAIRALTFCKLKQTIIESLGVGKTRRIARFHCGSTAFLFSSAYATNALLKLGVSHDLACVHVLYTNLVDCFIGRVISVINFRTSVWVAV